MNSPLFFVKKKIAVLAGILAAAAIVLSGCTTCSYSVNINVPGKTMSERTSYLMHTVVIQKWYGENAEETCDEIEDALTDFENETSLYIESSQISRINAAAGHGYAEVSEELFELISKAKELGTQSDGAFDVTIGPLVLLWNISGQDGDPHVPEEADIEEALSKVDYSKILLNEEEHSVMLADEGMKLDLGGIAKGYAAGLMRDIAEKNGVSGYLSIGGNMLVLGDDPDGEPFIVGIRDPLKDANSYFAAIDITGYTMATSSAAEIFFEEDGVKYHHILDPKTGYPGETDFLQVSVVSKDGALADALSTTIFLKGSECLEEYMNRDDCMVLAVTQDREVYGSDAIWDIVTPADTETYDFR
jgi:thiamine biosynthesis lipoprotein